MSFQIDWNQNEKIVLCQVQGSITNGDLWEIGHRLTAFLDDSCSPVHVIFDLESMERFPKQLPQIRHVLQDFLQHSQLASVTLVGRVNPLANYIFETLTKTFHVNYQQVVPDMQTAVRGIQAVFN